MNYKIFKNHLKEISCVAELISQRGWAEGNAGNISFNISEFVNKKINLKKYKINEFKQVYENLRENFILVTASGIKMRELAIDLPENIIVIYILNDGKSFISLSLKDIFENINSGVCKIKKPTSELPTHLAIHNYINKNKRKEKLVLHTHPTEIIALTQIKKFTNEKNINKLLWKMHPEMKIFLPEGIGFTPYILPGSNKLAIQTIKALKKHKAIIWEKHGCIAIAENIYLAFDIIDIITKSVKIFFLCKSAGFEPEGLKKSDLDELNKIFHQDTQH